MDSEITGGRTRGTYSGEEREGGAEERGWLMKAMCRERERERRWTLRNRHRARTGAEDRARGAVREQQQTGPGYRLGESKGVECSQARG